MRITNQMMINTNMADIQTNKLLLNKYNTQMSTQKKINKPSEDPIIAIRALRLRASLDQVSQYLDKNIPDASSWLSTTEGALDEANSILTSLYGYCTQGASDSYDSDQRSTIADTLSKLKESFYAEGDVEYAGRYVFTGFRTDTPLTYQSPEDAEGVDYTITQNFTRDALTTKTAYTNAYTSDDIMNLTVKTPTPNVATVHTLRLGYDSVSSDNFSITYNKTDISMGADGAAPQITTYQLDADGNYELDDDGNKIVVATTTATANADGTYSFTDSTGTAVTTGITTDDNCVPSDDAIILNAGTGEVLLGANVYSSVYTSDEFSITYNKNNFQKGDVNPTMYFDCVDNNTGIEYIKKDEDVNYNVNFSQKIKVNTEANDSFDIYLGRDIDRLVTAVNNVQDIEKQIDQVKAMQKEERYNDDESQKTLSSMIEGLTKQKELAEEEMTNAFENGVGQMQGYQHTISLAKADVGNRESRVNLTKTRLTEQKTNFTSLKSNNEDIDLEEVVISYSAAELVYNASLTAASKVVQQTLLDFL